MIPRRCTDAAYRSPPGWWVKCSKQIFWLNFLARSLVQPPDRSTFCIFFLFLFRYMFSNLFTSLPNTDQSYLVVCWFHLKNDQAVFLLSTGSSSSTPFSTSRQPLSHPLSLPPLPGTQSSYRSPQNTRRQVSSSLLHLKLWAINICQWLQDEIKFLSVVHPVTVFLNYCRYLLDAIAFALNVHNSPFAASSL